MSRNAELIYRKAVISDVKEMQAIIKSHADNDEMLPRSLNMLYEQLRDFTVCESEGKVCGCCALHVMWEDLSEIRSVAIAKDFQRRGIGMELVQRAIEEARQLGLSRVFLLTYKPDYFKRFNFNIIEKSELPHKVWTECINCPKFPDCGEVAMIQSL
jgi:amino-acid N-acetyltransferase